MSTRSNGISTKHGPRNVSGGRTSELVLCLRNDGYEASLEPRKLYAVVPDRDARTHDQLRVIDESGEDYLFPAALFAKLVLSQAIRRALLAAG
jgi:hypothetical protein